MTLGVWQMLGHILVVQEVEKQQEMNLGYKSQGLYFREPLSPHLLKVLVSPKTTPNIQKYELRVVGHFT